MGTDPAAVGTHRLRNLAHSLALMLAMALLTGGVGWLLAGWVGVAWALALVAATALANPAATARAVMALHDGRPLGRGNAPGLVALVEGLARRAGLERAPEVYFIPKAAPNAFAVGGRDDAGIGVTEGLLRMLNPAEMAGVLGHEIAHLRNGDLRWMTLAANFSRLTRLMCLAGLALVALQAPLLAMTGETLPWAALALLMAAPVVSDLLLLAFSRSREYEADLGAARITGDPLALASALAKIEGGRRLLDRWANPFGAAPEAPLLRSHPANRERVRRLLELGGHGAPRLDW